MTLVRRIAAAVLLAAISFPVTRLGAQARQAQPETRDAERVDARSPRAALADFLSLTRRGQFEAAAQYLDSAVPPGRGAELAQRLKAVFDQVLPIDLNRISALATGDTADRLTARDQIGSVRSSAGVLQPVVMQRQPATTDPGWVFAASTVDRIDEWYAAIGNHWIRERMPEALLRPGPLGVALWQWMVLIGLFVVAIPIGWVAGRITVAIAQRAAQRTHTTVDDRLIARTRAPLLALWSVLAYRALVKLAGLSIAADDVVGLLVRASFVGLTTWIIVRVTYVFEEELPTSTLGGQNAQVRSFAPLIGRVARIFVIALGLIGIVAQFGYSVGTVLTGVGIGGIALAFAAQKTLEHPFGSIALGLDQPIRIGDWVKIGETEGEVEAIGLRSTRIRTLARTIVVFPNGRLAEMQMENFGVRDRILLRTRIGLTYDTTADQMRRVREGMEQILTDHPLVWPDRIIVRFKGFAESSLDFDVIAWIASSDYNIFRAAREEIYLKFMELIEAEGCKFAFPTRMLVSSDAGDRASRDGKETPVRRPSGEAPRIREEKATSSTAQPVPTDTA